MKKKAIIFNYENNNFYSLTPLVTAIDSNDKLEQIDLFLEKNLSPIVIKEYLTKYKNLIIAFSFRSAQIGDSYSLMKSFYSTLSRSDLERIIFIAGGSHPTGDPSSVLKMGFDYVFIGEGELSISLFLEQWIESNEFKKLPGIAYFEEFPENIKINPNPPPINLDDYPILSKKRKLFPPLEITRGCPFGCSFCQVPSLFHGKVRHRSPTVILDTVEWMGKRKLDDIRFITPNSFGYMANHPHKVNSEVVINLLKDIKSTPGIRRIFYGTFPGEVRPETVSEEFLLKIKPTIANRRIAIGMQSGSDHVLRLINRGHTVSEGLNAIKTIKKVGFIPVVDFIFGLPGAKEQDELESINIIHSLIDLGAKIRPHVFMPLPGTRSESAPIGSTTRKIRKVLGKLSQKKKIEGNWSNQEKYAKNSWKILQKVKHSPIIHR